MFHPIVCLTCVMLLGLPRESFSFLKLSFLCPNIDPGRFSRVDGKKYHDNLGAVEPDIPENFQANDWKHYATDYDPEGWFYANSYRSQTWDKDQGTNV